MSQTTDKQVKTFTFNPHKVGIDPRTGRTGIIDRYPYKIYEALGVGKVYFTTLDGKYWSGEGKEVDLVTFEKEFLPYLRWKFDEIVKREVKDEKGNVIGEEVVNKFPPSTKNILKKRAELVSDSFKGGSGEMPDMQEIYKLTSPTHMECPPDVREALKPRGFLGSSYRALKSLLRS